ncbi:hypothetical protein KR026_011184 [Drosophila bipectinata]|nr:hypothetical protein KR026_011184 [Drosophila bipectinata]
MSPKNNHDPTSSGDSGNTNVQEADLQGESFKVPKKKKKQKKPYLACPAEMEDVNQSLDALSCALDAVEQRTDDIMSQLRALLNSNREIRRQLAEEKDQAADQDQADDDMQGAGEPTK